MNHRYSKPWKLRRRIPSFDTKTCTILNQNFQGMCSGNLYFISNNFHANISINRIALMWITHKKLRWTYFSDVPSFRDQVWLRIWFENLYTQFTWKPILPFMYVIRILVGYETSLSKYRFLKCHFSEVVVTTVANYGSFGRFLKLDMRAFYLSPTERKSVKSLIFESCLNFQVKDDPNYNL